MEQGNGKINYRDIDPAIEAEKIRLLFLNRETAMFLEEQDKKAQAIKQRIAMLENEKPKQQ
jgi:hypothetical protein